MAVSAERILSHLNTMQKSALLLFDSGDQSPINGLTSYQKQLFFIANYDQNVGDEADFEPYYYGPFSQPAETALEVLISYGLVENSGGKNYYSLTELGKELVSSLKVNPEFDLEQIEEVKDLFSGMTENELILFTYVLHPEYTTESKIKSDILAKRVAHASSLYRKGKVGLEMAAYLADLSMEEFLDRLRR